MRTRIFLSTAIFFFGMTTMVESTHAQSAADRLAASPRHQEWVTIESEGGDSFSAFIVYPERSTASDSVVVIHDISAMSDWARLVGDELAAKGYLAIVPDLLSGKGPENGNTESFTDRAEAGRAMRALDPDEVTARLRAAVAYARNQPSTTDAVSIAGFCWGGSQAFRLATNEPTLKAAFVFYGSPPSAESMTKIQCPVYGYYAENDNRINATIEDTKQNMADLGKIYEPVIYEGVGHGFVRTGMGETPRDIYRLRTGEAWERWLTLLGEK
ncbi:MAG: dienelactone hydrolase family protein [Candidatus Hydrogenedentes bacterium]|nr:dienelactone hydrolase family protein [Candidatus Hydrogenedentota bacterium]